MTVQFDAGREARLVSAVPYVMPTQACHQEHVDRVGGKAAGLGSLMRAGQNVPASFVVTTAAYFDYAESTPPGLSLQARDEIHDAYEALCRDNGGDVTVAVRSSAVVEDSADASYAGQFRTFLGASSAEEVIEQIELCFVEAQGAHVSSYGETRDAGNGKEGVAVVVQQLVDAHCAGVMFTQHPRTGDPSLVVVESSWGLGESVVSAEVVPDLFEINKITSLTHHSSQGSKESERRLAPDGRSVIQADVEVGRQEQWSLSDGQLSELVTMSRQLERELGRGLDIEWAYGTAAGNSGDPQLFALQVRPITVDNRSVVPKAEQRDAIDQTLMLFRSNTGQPAPQPSDQGDDAVNLFRAAATSGPSCDE